MIESLIGKLNDKERNADGSINGYLYQFELTLYHILVDASDKDAFSDVRENENGIFKAEIIEDYCKYFIEGESRHLRLAQIKYHQSFAGPSTYRDAVLWLYMNYLKFVIECSEDEEIDYKACIFYHDRSPSSGKVIRNILESAISEKEDKKKELQSKSKGNDNSNDEDDKKEKKITVYDRICTLEQENNLERDSFIDNFCYITSFKATPDIYDLQTTIKESLNDRYKELKKKFPYYTKELMYDIALSKVISDWRAKKNISLDDLDKLFEKGSISIEPDFYENAIIEFFIYCKGQYLESVIEESKKLIEDVQNELINQYDEAGKRIENLIVEKFQNEEYRRSFLKTLSAAEVNEYESNTVDEYNVFLMHRTEIRSFIVKLSKMIYLYVSLYDNKYDLSMWFDINSDTWIFKYPIETRNNGVIMADYIRGDSIGLLIGSMQSRYNILDKKPHIWYFDCINEGFSSHKAIAYKLDFTKPDFEHSPYDVDNEHFHIECLKCLKVSEYNNVCPNLLNLFGGECPNAK